MCVIAGYLGSEQAAPILLDMLERQEGFSGATFAGIVTLHDGQLHCAKVVGDTATLRKAGTESLPGTIGIAHIRPPGKGDHEQAHPFLDNEQKLAYLANGARGAFEGITDLSVAARKLFECGHVFRSAVSTQYGSIPNQLPDGRFVHGSDVLCHDISQNLADSPQTPDSLLDATVKTFEDWPCEIAALCLHVDHPNEIVAARHNYPIVHGRNAAGANYVASMPLAFDQDVNWRSWLPARAGVRITRDGVITTRPFTRQGFEVADLPSATAIENAVIRVLRESGPRKGDELMKLTKPLWPAGKLIQKEVAIYEVLSALRAEGRIKLEKRQVPSPIGRGQIPETWVHWCKQNAKTVLACAKNT